jgi:hypothetical protein
MSKSTTNFSTPAFSKSSSNVKKPSPETIDQSIARYNEKEQTKQAYETAQKAAEERLSKLTQNTVLPSYSRSIPEENRNLRPYSYSKHPERNTPYQGDYIEDHPDIAAIKTDPIRSRPPPSTKDATYAKEDIPKAESVPEKYSASKGISAASKLLKTGGDINASSGKRVVGSGSKKIQTLGDEQAEQQNENSTTSSIISGITTVAEVGALFL